MRLPEPLSKLTAGSASKMARVEIVTDLSARQISKFKKLFDSMLLKNGKAYFLTREMHGVLQTNSRQGAINIIQAHLSIVQIYLLNEKDDQYIKHIGIDVLLDALGKENPGKEIHYLAARAYISAFLANNPNVFKEVEIAAKKKKEETIKAMHFVRNHATHCMLTGKMFGKDLECHIHHIEGVSEQPELATDIKNLIPLCEDVHKTYHLWVNLNQLAVTRATLKQFAKEFNYKTDW